MSKNYRIYLFVPLIILLFPVFGHCQIIDGGRGKTAYCISEKSFSLTFGTSLEFHKFSPDKTLLSLFGEIGMNFSVEDSMYFDEKNEYLGLIGCQLWLFLHSKFYTEIRASLNVIDLLFRENQKIGWVLEGGILIPFSDRFWLTFNVGIGTAFSIDKNSEIYFSSGIIDKEFFSMFGFLFNKPENGY